MTAIIDNCGVEVHYKANKSANMHLRVYRDTTNITKCSPKSVVERTQDHAPHGGR